MYCPKCGTQNPDNTRICSSCSCVLTAVSTSAPAPDAKTSGLAIASFVLGIVSIFCLFFTAIPAVILGIISLVKIGQSAGRLKGKGLAIAGIAVPGVWVFLILPMLMATLMPALARSRELAQRTVCGANLRQISPKTSEFF